jgi:hypothetical protein
MKAFLYRVGVAIILGWTGILVIFFGLDELKKLGKNIDAVF